MPIPPAQNSLVKYDNPVQITTTKDVKGATKPKKPASAGDKPKQTTQTEDVLNSILPPREWTEGGKLWVQYVSSTPATRLDVVTLQEQLDQRLQHRQARETGICPIREELYAQCFDELIRQITINCAERGLLLLRVRDEIRMTIAAYQTLYESSIAFGMRKALSAEQSKNRMQAQINQLQQEKQESAKTVADLEAKVEAVQKRIKQQQQEEEQKHQDDIAVMKKHNQSLREELETLLSIEAPAKSDKENKSAQPEKEKKAAAVKPSAAKA